MRNRLLAVTAVLALAIGAAFVAGCGGSSSSSSSGGGTITVGSDIPYPPFEQGQAPNYTGFDVDIVDAIGKQLGRDIQWKDTSFDTIFRDLAQGKFDMVASATTITKERLKTVDFSQPYFNADQSLMVKKGSDIQTVDDLSGKTVGAQKGTTGAAYAQDHTDAASVRTYPQIDNAFNALEAGQVDAVINDFPVSAFATKSKPDLAVVQSIPTGEEYGLPLPKGSDLESDVNDALTKIKQDGTYAEIFKKWFNQEPPQSILDNTASPDPNDPNLPAS
jgi:ABC-type amino acid transport substrate-binding protein